MSRLTDEEQAELARLLAKRDAPPEPPTDRWLQEIYSHPDDYWETLCDPTDWPWELDNPYVKSGTRKGERANFKLLYDRGYRDHRYGRARVGKPMDPDLDRHHPAYQDGSRAGYKKGLEDRAASIQARRGGSKRAS